MKVEDAPAEDVVGAGELAGGVTFEWLRQVGFCLCITPKLHYFISTSTPFQCQKDLAKEEKEDPCYDNSEVYIALERQGYQACNCIIAKEKSS